MLRKLHNTQVAQLLCRTCGLAICRAAVATRFNAISACSARVERVSSYCFDSKQLRHLRCFTDGMHAAGLAHQRTFHRVIHTLLKVTIL